MNLEVEQQDLCKTLESVRKLIAECILPRLDQLESELFYLRRLTWPVCSILSERTPVDGEWFRDKAYSFGDDRYLLVKKNKLSKYMKPGDVWRHDRTHEEHSVIRKCIENSSKL